jgi:putative ABC transport system permease protein
MAVRNMSRTRFRSVFLVVGIAFSFALTALMGSFNELFDSMLMDQFKKVELYNVKVSLKAPAAADAALESGMRLPGVHRAEALLELPAKLRLEHLSEDVAMTALEADSQLFHLYDSERGTELSLPPGGLVLTDNLAGELKAKRGDILTVTTAYTGDDEYRLPVLGVFRSNLGRAAYITLDSLWETLESPRVLSALLLDAEDPNAVRQELEDAANVSAITDQGQTLRVYEDLIDAYAFMLYMMQLAGAGVAFAIITNTASISLSERKREYATMRVLGMHPREIGRVVAFEYWVLAALALPPGVGLTRLLKQGLSTIIRTEMFSFPVTTQPASYITAAVFCGLAVLLSNLLASRKIARFDMVEVLKERE